MKLASLFILIPLLLPAFWLDCKSDPNPDLQNASYQKENVSLLEFLRETGNINNCFFTIEEAWQDGEAFNQVESTRINKAFAGAKTQSALQSLRESAPNLTYTVSKQNPNIIHLTDVRLLRQGRYGVESIVTHINFEGTSGELIDELRNRGVSVQRPALLDISEARRLKSDAKMKVNGSGLKVREILSGFTTLENRGRILWIARTKLGTNEVTNLYLYR